MSREAHVRFRERRGVRLPPATLLVVLCKSEAKASAALEKVRSKLAELRLELHPEKTRIVDLRRGREGFDFRVPSKGPINQRVTSPARGSRQRTPVVNLRRSAKSGRRSEEKQTCRL